MTSPIDGLITELKEKGINGINDIIARKEQEQFFIDFKEFSIGDYSGKKSLEDSDRKNFAKAISGFGNSEGGILIWGIGGKSHAEELKPVKGYETFLGLVNSFVSRSTIPVHTSVENFSITSEAEFGFVITVIPKSENTPHRTIDGQKEGQYYMRAGDSFLPVPHSVLAGMFGRRPNPKLSFNFLVVPPKVDYENKLIIEKHIVLRNDGAGLARHVYCHGMINTMPESMNNTEVFKFTGKNNEYRESMAFWRQMQCYSIGDFMLAPGQFSQPFCLKLSLHPPINDDLKIKIGYGCEGQEKGIYELFYSKEKLLKVYSLALKGISASELSILMEDATL